MIRTVFSVAFAFLLVAMFIVGIAVLIWLAVLIVGQAAARDLGQWNDTDPALRQWYKSLLQPDTITIGASGLVGSSCCGEADSYFVDVYVRSNWMRGTEIVAIIDDDRDDQKLMRIHEEPGTQYVIPPNKIVGEKQRIGNPTGRAVVFLGATTMGGGFGDNHRLVPRPVLCFVDDTGF